MANPKLKVDPAHTDAAPGPAPAFHFSVRAVADPSVLSRVVEHLWIFLQGRQGNNPHLVS